MTTSFAMVRDGLENRLKQIPGLHVTAHVPDDIAGLPAAFIYPPTTIDYGDDLDGGSVTVDFIVMLLVPSAIDRQQLSLYELLDRTGPQSVFAVIMADRSLGGLNVDCRVVDATDPLDRGQIANSPVYQRSVTVRAIVT